jgi:hypothetical protein
LVKEKATGPKRGKSMAPRKPSNKIKQAACGKKYVKFPNFYLNIELAGCQNCF